MNRQHFPCTMFVLNIPVPRRIARSLTNLSCRLVFTWILVVVFLLKVDSANLNAALLDGIGVLGASDSDEYEFGVNPDFDRTKARNWVELLATNRGLNFGTFSSESRGEPRRQGFEFNWARGGETAIRGLKPQIDGVVEQVASGDVSLVYLAIGVNDFGFQVPGAQYRAIHDGRLAGDELEHFIRRVTGMIEYGVDAILDAGDAQIVIGNIFDGGDWPIIDPTSINAEGRAKVTESIMRANMRLQEFANRKSIPIVDNFGIAKLSVGTDLVIGGVQIDKRGSSNDSANDPRNFFVDRVHQGTVVQGLDANAFVAAINRAYDANVRPLSDQEILTAAKTFADFEIPFDDSIETFFDVSDFVQFNPQPASFVDLVSKGEHWKFFRGTEEPSPFPLVAWSTRDFDDSDWEDGQEGFGYRLNDDIATELSDMRGNYTSIFLRNEFAVADPTAVEELSFQIRYSDEFIAYINGVEVARSLFGETGTPVPADTKPGNGPELAPIERFVVDLDMFPDLLTSGEENVLSIQGIDRSLGSNLFELSNMRLIAVSESFAFAAGDFNGNGMLDSEDLDLLAVEIGNISPNTSFDLNGDGTVDLDDRLNWIHDLKNTWVGDSNLDDEFNTADFVLVFQAGEFEDDLPGNSTWATGDWNGDLEFDTADFVLAFQDSGFEMGRRAAASAVPEASSLLLIIAALIGIAKQMRRSVTNVS